LLAYSICPVRHETYKSKGVDKAVDLVAGHDTEPLDPGEARRIRNKIDRVVLPLLFSVYIREYAAKGPFPQSTPALALLTQLVW